MAHGLQVKNADNHLMISSDVAAFHYGGKAAYVKTLDSGLTDFPEYSGDDNTQTLSGRTIHRYAVIMPAPDLEPLVFIRPGNDVAYGVLRTYPNTPGATLWIIEIIQRNSYGVSGHNVVRPRSVLCFYQLLGVKAPKDPYGLATFLPNGDLAFDSGRKPLAVRGVIPSVIPPEIPCEGGAPTTSDYGRNSTAYYQTYTLDHDFMSDTTENAYPTVGVDRDNLAFTAPALVQGVYARSKSAYRERVHDYTLYKKTKYYVRVASWWAMYQSVFRLSGSGGGTTLHAGWAPYAAGFYAKEEVHEVEEIALGGVLFGLPGALLGTIPIATDSDATVAGSQPYAQKTINYQPNTVVLIDASVYE